MEKELLEKIFDDVGKWLSKKKVFEEVSPVCIAEPRSFSCKGMRAGAGKKKLLEAESLLEPEFSPDVFEEVFSENFAVGPIEASEIDDIVKNKKDSFQDLLIHFINLKNLTEAEVYKKAGIDRRLFSKIRSTPNYHPRKDTVFALALGLELNLDQAKDFLSRAGYDFSQAETFDLIIEFFITKQIYDFFIINKTLEHYGQPLLGAEE